MAERLEQASRRGKVLVRPARRSWRLRRQREPAGCKAHIDEDQTQIEELDELLIEDALLRVAESALRAGQRASAGAASIASAAAIANAHRRYSSQIVWWHQPWALRSTPTRLPVRCWASACEPR